MSGTQKTLFPELYPATEPELNVIPFFIDKRYVNYLYNTFENKEVRYTNKTVKAVRVYHSSAFGKYLSLLLIKSKKPLHIEKCELFFAIDEPGKKSGIYKNISGKFSLLEVPAEFAKDLTHYIHDQFIVSLTSFVDGCSKSGTNIMESIEIFMDKYDLWDDWDKRYLQRQYYREKNHHKGDRMFSPRKK